MFDFNNINSYVFGTIRNNNSQRYNIKRKSQSSHSDFLNRIGRLLICSIGEVNESK
jgi:hypothetical protein